SKLRGRDLGSRPPHRTLSEGKSRARTASRLGGRCRRGRRFAQVLGDVQLVHLAVQARYADTELFRRLGLVIVMAAEAVEDVLALELLERFLQVLARVVGHAFDGERQV